MSQYPASLPSTQQGVVLLESLIAVLIFSLGLLALTGLQAAMIKNTDDAKYRAEASFIAQQKLSEIWLNEAGNGTLAGYIINAGDSDSDVDQLPGGKITVAVAGDNSCLITVTVNWTVPGREEHTYLANAVVKGVNWCN